MRTDVISVRLIEAVVMTPRLKKTVRSFPTFVQTLYLSNHANRTPRWFSNGLRPTRFRLNPQVMIIIVSFLCVLATPSSGASYYSLMPSISSAPSEYPTSAPTPNYYYYTASPTKLLTSSSIPTVSPLSTEQPLKEGTPVPSGTPSPSPILETNNPTIEAAQPTRFPTSLPTPSPTGEPVSSESFNSVTPTKPPNNQNPAPTESPLPILTDQPSNEPKIITKIPTLNPTPSPTVNLTPSPTANPTPFPTVNSTPSPTVNPTPSPTVNPTPSPTVNSTSLPSITPTEIPTSNPQLLPIDTPTARKTIPTLSPTKESLFSTKMPFEQKTALPTGTLVPSHDPTANNITKESSLPSTSPTSFITESFNTVPPTRSPSFTKSPFKQPKILTKTPTSPPTKNQTSPSPTPSPTVQPVKPKPKPSKAQTESPTLKPQATPTNKPTAQKTTEPTKKPRNPKPMSSTVTTDPPTQNPQPILTDRPTAQPTPSPTSEPTKKPQNPQPISSPVATDSPTQNPQPIGTNKPTAQPTTEPTEKPRNPKPISSPVTTDPPTQNPQPIETNNPTAQPTTEPTKKPRNPKPMSSTVTTDPPTQNPQPIRTNDPTAQPTKTPMPSTSTPTDSLFSTSMPSRKTTTESWDNFTPSPAPTKNASTRIQTVTPSGPSIESFNSASPIKPTKENSTELLTQRPTNNPTPSPTKKPKAVPARDLTEKPLPTPLSMPVTTNRPTAQPTKTTMPSRRPSFAPTLVLQVSPVISNVVMEFDDCQKLENSSIALWRRVTTEFVADSMSTNLLNNGMAFSDLRVKIIYKTQFGPWSVPNNSTNSTADGSSRYLQTQLSPLSLFFDVLIKLRSTNHQHDWQSYFIGTLNTKEKLVAYLKQLSTSGDDAFGSINNVTVEINGQSISQVQQIPESQLKKSLGGTGLILVCASAATAVAAITAIMFILFRRKTAANPKKEYNSEGDRVASIDDDIYIEIEHKMDDVSTLGNMFGNNYGSEQKFEDPTVGESTMQCNTVYQNLIGTTDHKGRCKLSRPNSPSPNPYSNLMEDDIIITQEGVEGSPPFQGATLGRKQPKFSEHELQEETVKPTLLEDSETVCYGEPSDTEIEVNAPPGKLGVLIDANKIGELKVNSVRSSSPLGGLIRVGDILKSIDGEVTSGLTADQASNLITSKADHHNRVLVFIRKGKSSQESRTAVNS